MLLLFLHHLQEFIGMKKDVPAGIYLLNGLQIHWGWGNRVLLVIKARCYKCLRFPYDTVPAVKQPSVFN